MAARRRRLSVLGCVALAAFALTAGGIHWVRAQRRATAEALAREVGEPEPYDYGEATPRIQQLREQLAKEPCDRRRIIELAETVMRAGDNRGTLFHANAFFKTCGDHSHLRWITYAAHKQVSEWDLAAAEATKLIESDPYDPDFRGWRGFAYEQKGDFERAAQDYRQALVLRPHLRDLPLNLANVYERQGKPCDAILPLAQLVFYHPKAVGTGGVLGHIQELEAKPECRWSLGEGRARVRRTPGQSVFVVKVRVNERESGSFVVDTGATLVVLARAFADKLRVDVNGASLILAQTANGLATGSLVVLDQVAVEGIHAVGVPAAVTEGLGDIDGLLGMSFLTRFEMRQNADVLELSTRKR